MEKRLDVREIRLRDVVTKYIECLAACLWACMLET
jgi:hypothetical protein